jgi:plastocyanin
MRTLINILLHSVFPAMAILLVSAMIHQNQGVKMHIQTMRRIRTIGSTLTLAAFLLLGCFTPLRAKDCACKGSGPFPKACTIHLQTGASPSNPETTCVARGGTVTWVENGDVHDDWEVKFDKPGSESPFKEGATFHKGSETGTVLTTAKLKKYSHHATVNGTKYDPHIVIGK